MVQCKRGMIFVSLERTTIPSWYLYPYSILLFYSLASFYNIDCLELKIVELSVVFKSTINDSMQGAKTVNDRSTFSLRLLHVYGGVLKQPPRVLHQRQYLRDARRAETFSVG